MDLQITSQIHAIFLQHQHALFIRTNQKSFDKGRVPHLCCRSSGDDTYPHNLVCASLWAVAFGCLHRNLFSCGISHGLLFSSMYSSSPWFHVYILYILSHGCFLVVIQVMGVKAIGMALKLTLEGQNQFKYFQTWFFVVYVVIFIILQLNYLNKVLVLPFLYNYRVLSKIGFLICRFGLYKLFILLIFHFTQNQCLYLSINCISISSYWRL